MSNQLIRKRGLEIDQGREGRHSHGETKLDGGANETVAAAPRAEPVAGVAGPPKKKAYASRQTSEDWHGTKDVDWNTYNKHNLTHEERLRYLVPNENSFNLLPFLLKEKDKPKERYNKAVAAAEHAVRRCFDEQEELQKEKEVDAKNDKRWGDPDNDSNDDGSSSDEGYRIPSAYEWDDWLSLSHALHFVRSLPQNLTFTASFDATGSNSKQNKLCHCPCSKMSHQWLKLIGHDDLLKRRYESCNSWFEHYALVAHLRDKRKHGCPLHRGVLAYLESLYSKCNGPYDHEALYKNQKGQMKMYSLSLAYRLAKMETKLADLQEQVQEHRQLRDKVAEEDEKQKLALARDRKVHDALVGSVGNIKFVELPEDTIKKVETDFRALLRLTIKFGKLEKGKVVADQIRSDDIDGLDFDINKTFDAWSCKQGSADKSCLFRDITKVVRYKLLTPAKWHFAGIGGTVGLSDKAKDEGGPTNEFLQLVWDQLGELSVVVEGQGIKLFFEDDCGSGHMYAPFSDEILKENVRKALGCSGEMEGHGGAEQAMEKIRLYYRAIGRLMCHSIAIGETFPCNLFNGVCRSYIFANKKPTDAQYEAAELFSHLKEMEMNFTAAKDYTHDDGNIRKMAEEYLIRGRKTSLSCMRKGLTLEKDEFFAPFRLFSCQSTQALDRIMFAAHCDLSVKTLLENVECVVQCNSSERKKTLNPKQQKFKETTLPAVLHVREKQQKRYASRLLQHWTAIPYLKRSNPTITIVFERLAGGDENARPVAHTCEKELCFPLTAYDANAEVLGNMLDEAMGNCCMGGFNMA